MLLRICDNLYSMLPPSIPFTHIAESNKRGPSNNIKPAFSALDKANALTKKISSWSSRAHLRHRQVSGSESDDSIRVSESGKRPGSADTSIGRDGNKFLKKKAVPNESPVGKRSPSPQLNYQRSMSQEKMEVPLKSRQLYCVVT